MLAMVFCKGNQQNENAFFEVASFYDGSENSAQRALKGLKSASATTDNLNMVVVVCSDQIQSKLNKQTCNEVFDDYAHKGNKEDFSPKLFAARFAVALHEVLMTENDLCSAEVKHVAQQGEAAKPGALSHLYRGISAYCTDGKMPEKSLRHETLVEYLDNARSDTLQMLRSASQSLVFWPGQPADARFYYRSQRLLRTYKLATLQELIAAAPKSTARTLISAESAILQNLIAPNQTKKNSFGLDELSALAENADKCQSDLCRFTAAKAYQLLGEHRFQRRRYSDAVNAFVSCRSISGSGECLEQSAIARLAGGKKIPEGDQILLKNRVGRGFVSNFLSHSVGENGAFELRDRFMQSAKTLPSHKRQRMLNDLVREIKSHPYLRGRAPFEINIAVTESKDAVAHFARGAGYIFIGDKFLEMLEQATKGSDFSLEDILAVTLGHEIHHLIAGHGIDSCNVLNHQEQFAFGRAGVSNVLVNAAHQHESWRREFESDENGMLYAFLIGKKAGAFLATLYVVGREEKSGGNATHPATVERIRVLREKMQVLSVAATAFNRANDSLKEIDKLVRAGKSPTDAQLQATERDLITFSEIIPGYPAAHVNLSFIALRRILNRVRSPEMPTMAMMNTEMNLVVPSAPASYAASGQTCTLRADICSVKSWRPAIGKGWDQTTIALIRSAQSALERSVAAYPDDYRLQNNLALTWYYLVEAEISAKPDLGCKDFPAASRKRLRAYLDLAEKHLDKAQANSPEVTQDMAHNRAAVEIARFHLDKDPKHLQKARGVFLSPGKEKDIGLRPGIRFNDALAFALGYARTLELYLHLSNQSPGKAITDLEELDTIERDTIAPAKDYLAGLISPKATTHWQRELAALKVGVDKVLMCEKVADPPKAVETKGAKE